MPSDRPLNDLADSVAEEFEAYRNPDGFNELSLVIDNSDRERPALIVHIDREQAADLAAQVEAFLRDHSARTERAEPDVPLYADMLLLFDALEREDPTAFSRMDTSALINLYTLLSDVQRNSDDLRKDVSDILLERVQHDRPVHG